MSWIRIAAADIPEREGRVVRVGAQPVAVFNLGGRFVAMDNQCPHGGGPLADGIVNGKTVTCPLHNWRVCLESGKVVKPCDHGHGSVKTYDVRVESGMVMLRVDGAVSSETVAAA